jgi:hypothetical protein
MDSYFDEIYRKPAFIKTPPTVLSIMRGHLLSSSSSTLQNKSDDEAMDELKHNWASEKLKIDYKFSDDE